MISDNVGGDSIGCYYFRLYTAFISIDPYLIFHN